MLISTPSLSTPQKTKKQAFHFSLLQPGLINSSRTHIVELSEMKEEDSRKLTAKLLLRSHLGFKYQTNILRCCIRSWIKLRRFTSSFCFFYIYFWEGQRASLTITSATLGSFNIVGFSQSSGLLFYFTRLANSNHRACLLFCLICVQ